MFSTNTRLKSVLLGLSILVAMPATNRAETPATGAETVCNFVKNNKIALSVFMMVWFYAESDLRTKGKGDYSWSQLPDDIRDFLNSNFLSLEPLKQLRFMFKKYFVGLPVKLNEVVDITKKENGDVVKMKSKKLVQKPFGLYGNFDAYVLMHLKKFTDYIPVLAGMYLLLNNPAEMWGNAITKANK